MVMNRRRQTVGPPYSGAQATPNYKWQPQSTADIINEV